LNVKRKKSKEKKTKMKIEKELKNKNYYGNKTLCNTYITSHITFQRKTRKGKKGRRKKTTSKTR